MYRESHGKALDAALGKEEKNKNQMTTRSNGSKPVTLNASETEAVTDFTSRPPQNK
jgi:hypothetical protein